MTTDEANTSFNEYVSSAVNYYKRKKGWTNTTLSIQVNMSESFIKQANIGKRHYNAYHIWLLANSLGIPVCKLLPPSNIDSESFKQYQEILPYSNFDDFKNFIQLIRNEK